MHFSSKIEHDDVANFTEVCGKMLVKLNKVFFAKRCAPATLCLANKVW